MKNRNIDWKTKLKVSEILSILGVLAAALLLGVFLVSQVFAVADVKEISMENTLHEGDRLFVSKLAYTFREPERGDVVIFLKGEEVGGFFDRYWRGVCDIFNGVCGVRRENRLVKRVIGLPGDDIEIKSGSVYINGEELVEDYTVGPTGSANFTGVMHIPEGMYFLMGDNRVFSNDSRNFGLVSRESLEGQAKALIWPPSKWESLGAQYND